MLLQTWKVQKMHDFDQLIFDVRSKTIEQKNKYVIPRHKNIN